MKKNIFPALIFVCISMQAINLTAQSCCSKPQSTQAFAMLTHDDKFVAAHLDPVPFNFTPESGKMVKFETKDGKAANAFLVPAQQESKKYLIVIHEWWGLNDYIKKQCEAYAKDFPNMNILALDLYDGAVAKNKDEASKFMGEAKEERVRAIITGMQAYLGNEAQCMTIGWCFGGGWSMQTAMMLDKQCKGCIIYYGMPEKDKEKLMTINFPILGIFAQKDQWITPEIYNNFRDAMKINSKQIEIVEFDADHAFANPSNPQFNQEFTTKANDAVYNFIKTFFE
ncbi:MAG TPA: dienelactone hydrolase family protein [Bacteroidia bacterium]|nr:dienelactone hydrolase family protein [Bacteroidia bacterium]